MTLDQLDTPALVIDLDIMERNLHRAADYARAHHLRLRPHTKTHKTPVLGRRQIELGAAGLTCAKVGEAEVMLAARPPDLLLAYPIVGRSKLERLAEVARATAVTVALDSAAAAQALSEAAQAHDVRFGVLAEMDAGLGRVGVRPGSELTALAREISMLPRLSFEGIAFYPGHIKDLGEGGRAALETLANLLERTLDELRAAGLMPGIVSGGSTPALFHSHALPGMNEIRPGTYIFNDRNTWAMGACQFEDCAASILATVVSVAHDDQFIIDGGSKTFSSDRLVTGADSGFGYVMEAPEGVFHKMNEEHGFVSLRDARERLRIGDRVRIIPNHVCVAVNLHERMYGVRGKNVERVWEVAARGKLQ